MTDSLEARPTAEHRLIIELLGRINELEARPGNGPRDEWLDALGIDEAEARAKMAHTIAQLQAALKAQRMEISSLRDRLAVAENPKLGRVTSTEAQAAQQHISTEAHSYNEVDMRRAYMAGFDRGTENPSRRGLSKVAKDWLEEYAEDREEGPEDI